MTKFHANIPFVASPNYSNRGDYAISGIVLHYTAGGHAIGTVNWFQNPQAKVSAHFIIDRNGDIIQMVDLEKAAWHAGSSMLSYRGKLKKGANRFTIGIELANYGLLHRDSHGYFWYERAGNMKLYRLDGAPKVGTLVFPHGHFVTGWWEPYPAKQIESLMWLLNELYQKVDSLDKNCIVGHEEIALPLGRKLDVGPLFPWQWFGRGVGTRYTQSFIETVEV